VRLFSPGFPPDDVFTHPRHEAAQKALPDLIGQLRAAANVKDGYELHQELIAYVPCQNLPVRQRVCALSRDIERSALGFPGAPLPDKPIDPICIGPVRSETRRMADHRRGCARCVQQRQ